jgi:hypothetical protein
MTSDMVLAAELGTFLMSCATGEIGMISEEEMKERDEAGGCFRFSGRLFLQTSSTIVWFPMEVRGYFQ